MGAFTVGSWNATLQIDEKELAQLLSNANDCSLGGVSSSALTASLDEVISENYLVVCIAPHFLLCIFVHVLQNLHDSRYFCCTVCFLFFFYLHFFRLSPLCSSATKKLFFFCVVARDMFPFVCRSFTASGRWYIWWLLPKEQSDGVEASHLMAIPLLL